MGSDRSTYGHCGFDKLCESGQLCFVLATGPSAPHISRDFSPGLRLFMLKEINVCLFATKLTVSYFQFFSLPIIAVLFVVPACRKQHESSMINQAEKMLAKTIQLKNQLCFAECCRVATG